MIHVGDERRARRSLWAAAVFLLLLLGGIVPLSELVSAAPGGTGAVSARHDMPPWMSPETAATLDLGFDVLVPGYVPPPFGGEPAVDVADGRYTLYWVVPGTPPTFLQITGEVGGVIPDYSKHDRNVQLVENAQVQGQPAFHDLTPIYDLVYWQVGPVVYTVESQNLSDDDSLALANGLLVLSPPADGGGDDETAAAPPAEETAAAEEPSASIACPESAASGETVQLVLGGTGPVQVEATGGAFPAEAPNVDFAPGAEGGTRLDGELAGEPVTLAWLAAVVPEEQPVDVVLFDAAGNTLGSCRVTVLAAPQATDEPAEAERTEAEPTEVEAAEAAVAESDRETGAERGVLAVVAPVSDGTGVDGGTVEQEEAEPTETPRPKKSKKNEEAVEAPELRGLPTAEAPEDEQGQDEQEQQDNEEKKDDEEKKEDESDAEPTRTSEPAVEPTATTAPTSSEDGMVASVIGPEGGTLETGTGVRIEIPEGALSAPSTVTIQPVAGSKLPVQEGIEPIPDTAFDVTVAGEDGRAIERLEQPAQLSVQVPEEHASTGMLLYRVEGTRLVAMSGVQVDGRTISTEVDGFSRFTAGVPAAVTDDGGRRLLPLVLAALVALVAMILLITFGGAMRRRRPRSVGPRRSPRRPTYR